MKTIPLSVCAVAALLGSVACGNSSKSDSVVPGGGGSTSIPSTGGAGNTGPIFGSGGNGSSLIVDPGNSGGGSSGPSACQPGNTTTISGVVYDPAGKNPLYNISVYVADPKSPLPDLEKIPVSCGCSQLLPEKVLAIGAPTDATGHFEIPCAPSGNVTLVVQTGKWRRTYENVNVVANQANVIPNLRLPANSSEGSLPNIAISTGGYDSFECLPLRIGVAASEYVGGSSTGGHIHIYTGAAGATPAQGAVDSNKALWDTQEHLNEHDVVIMSCEGAETTGGPRSPRIGTQEQQTLMNYANAGGRVFASHFQFAWFNTGPFATGANNLATWNTTMAALDDNVSYPSEVNTTLSTGAAFPEGVALAKWLGLVGALTNNQLPVRYVRNNVLALMQPPSTEWLHLAPSVTAAPSATQYFSADTPIGAGADKVCGRVVYTALHVSGGPGKSVSGNAADADYPIPDAGGMAGACGRGMCVVPSGCSMHPLSPQELALEFMLFDLSSCLVPIGEEPPVIPK